MDLRLGIANKYKNSEHQKIEIFQRIWREEKEKIALRINRNKFIYK